MSLAAHQSEADWSRTFQSLFELLGWVGYHIPDSRRATSSGFPDWVLVNHQQQRLLFVELEREKGKVSEQQHWWIDVLRSCGCEAYIWRPSDYYEAEMALEGKRSS